MVESYPLRPAGLPRSRLSAKIAFMKRFALGSFPFLFAAMICTTAPAQLPSGDRSDAGRLDELARKIDHIENERKLQIGQTIMIPAPSSAPSPTPVLPNG